MFLCVLNELTFLWVNLNRCDRSSDSLLWWCPPVDYKAIYTFFNFPGLIQPLFCKKPSCWSSPSTATNKTPLIAFASYDVGRTAVLILQPFRCKPRTVGISCGLHPLDATSAWFSFVGIYHHWMQPSFVSLSPCCSQTARSLFYLSCNETVSPSIDVSKRFSF